MELGLPPHVLKHMLMLLHTALDIKIQSIVPLCTGRIGIWKFAEARW